MSTIRAFSLVVRALAAMLETLVRIQYIALLHASCLWEHDEGGKHTWLIHMHSTVRFCLLQPFTAQTAKLIFISTNSGTHDECRAFSIPDAIGSRTSFTPRLLWVRVPRNRPFSRSQSTHHQIKLLVSRPSIQ